MRVLITGITGTIGTAFTELLIKKGLKVHGVDHNEERVAKLRDRGVSVECGDFSEVDVKGFDLVIHLAAMKHIDICERNTNACVANNVIKTYQLFKNANHWNVGILFMSTDKAVEPTSMYGYSKALGEGMVREYGGAFVRSGNVVESTGSVLKIWDEAIEKGQPIKITHKDMRRFFITPDNLVRQIWQQYQAGVKEIIPEMDRNIYLVDLAQEKLAKYGYNLDNYSGGVEYIGLRPGEKLEEKLTWQP